MRKWMVAVGATMMLASFGGLAGCKKKGAACAKTATKDGKTCQECCKKAGAKGHSWVGGKSPTCKCK